MEYLPMLSAYCTFLPFITHEPSHEPECLSPILLLVGKLRSGEMGDPVYITGQEVAGPPC